MKYIVFLFFLGVLSKGFANCRIHQFEAECTQQKECVWDSRGCNVAPELDAVSNGHVVPGSTIEDNFKTSYHIEKTKA